MTAPLSTTQQAPMLPQRAGSYASALLVLGLAAFAGLAVGLRSTPERAFHAYLAAYAFALSLALGSLAFVLIAHAANTTWPVAVRRLPEAAAATMPLLALLFLPIIFGVDALYPWARPERFTGHVREVLEHRHIWMNRTGFTLRAGVYLLIWSGMALALRHASLAMERGADPYSSARRLRRLSYACLPCLALTVGLSAFEWFMSLSAEFSSTMFAAVWIAACLFGGQACTVLLASWALRSEPPRTANAATGSLTTSHLSALGRLLFAYLIFLAYTEFFQFLLAWMGNRPTEAAWFLERSQGVYWGVVLFLIFGHLGLPFLFLLSYRMKRNARALRAIAAYCLLCHYVHLHWLITPAAHAAAYSWLDITALVAVLAPSVGVGLFLQLGKPLAPVYDPRYAASLDYQSR